MSPLSFLLFVATLVPIALGQQCYGLDGTPLDSSYAPCNPNAQHSGCCATKRTNGSPDICLDSGLCMATSNEMMGTIWQRGCTDPTGEDVACPKLCPDVNNSFSGLQGVTAWNLQTCDFGKYCCRAANDKRSCCDNATSPGVTTTFIGALQTTTPPVPPTPVSSGPASTKLSVANVNPTAAPFSMPSNDATPASADVCSAERHKTAVVGGTLGGLFSAIILALLGLVFWLYKKELKQRKLKEHYEEQFSQTNAYRKALASSAGSIRGSILMEDFRPKSRGLDHR